VYVLSQTNQKQQRYIPVQTQGETLQVVPQSDVVFKEKDLSGLQQSQKVLTELVH
jgi:hypothetical protein